MNSEPIKGNNKITGRHSKNYGIYATETGKALATRATYARTLVERTVGLLNRESLEQGEGMIFERCCSIHTWFMRFAIDIIFVNRSWKVVALKPNLGPWGEARCHFKGAHAVIELPAGVIQAHALEVGDQLAVKPVVLD